MHTCVFRYKLQSSSILCGPQMGYLTGLYYSVRRWLTLNSIIPFLFTVQEQIVENGPSRRWGFGRFYFLTPLDSIYSSDSNSFMWQFATVSGNTNLRRKERFFRWSRRAWRHADIWPGWPPSVWHAGTRHHRHDAWQTGSLSVTVDAAESDWVSVCQQSHWQSECWGYIYSVIVCVLYDTFTRSLTDNLNAEVTLTVSLCVCFTTHLLAGDTNSFGTKALIDRKISGIY